MHICPKLPFAIAHCAMHNAPAHKVYNKQNPQHIKTYTECGRPLNRMAEAKNNAH